VSAEAHHALLAGRATLGIGRLIVWRPLLCAAIFWTLYALAAGMASTAAAAPPDVRHISGTDVVTTYDYTSVARTAATTATWMQLLATVTTIGAVTIGTLRLVSFRSAQRRSRNRLAVAASYIGAENRRAKRDVANAKARLGKVGEKRAGQWGKRWSREAAAGETYSNPGAVDRWLLRQTKPPKTKAAKKADRAAKKIGKADQRRQAAELDAEWDAELAAPLERATLLDPTDGPPLSPVQRAEYAERLKMSDRERLAADTAALFEGSTP
jgi:hypothetical protein